MNEQYEYGRQKINSSRKRPIRNHFRDRLVILALHTFFIGLFVFSPQYLTKRYDVAPHLNLYTYGDFIAPESLRAFEEEYGIQLRVKYFDNNEEALAQFRINKGVGYDVITVMDYVIEALRKDGLLSPLDHNKLPIIKELNPALLDRSYDPLNTYSLPFMWSCLGFGYSKEFFPNGLPNDGWELVFEPLKHMASQTFCMVDDTNELFLLSLLYLTGQVDYTTPKTTREIVKLLKKQKPFVESYTHASQPLYLISGTVPLAVASSNLTQRIMKDHEGFDFVIPRQGTLLAIDNLAVPATSTKKEEAYKLINFLLKEKVGYLNWYKNGDNPANLKACEHIDPSFRDNPHFFPLPDDLRKMRTVHTGFGKGIVSRAWMEVKTS